MGTTPPTHACAVRFMNFGAGIEKGASDRNSHLGLRSALGPSSTIDPGTERHSIQGIDLIDVSVELYVALN